MDALEEFKATYFHECDELLADLEAQLMALEEGSTDVETLHAAFRAIHSVKGGAGAFGFERLVSFAHTFETVLDLMRDGKVELEDDCIATAVRAGDILSDLVSFARSGDDPEVAFEADALSALTAIVDANGEGAEFGGEVEEGFDDFEFTPVPAGVDPEIEVEATEAMENSPPSALRTFQIAFRPSPDMFRRANEPLNFVRELKRLGSVTAAADLTALPSFADLDPDTSYLSWVLDIETSAGKEAIEEIFEFVADECDLAIDLAEPEDGPSPEFGEFNAEGEVFDAEARVTAEVAGSDFSSEAAADEQSTASKEAGDAQTKPEKSGAGAATQPTKPTQVASAATAIRVDLDKIDRLVNMVGELVITQAMISQQTDQALAEGYPELVHGLEQLHQHTRSLQDSVMSIRAQPVKSVFSRMPRLVRELSAQTGKKIRLDMSGEATEIDKTVIEQLNDPLTHMIRNAADHGVEEPDVRMAAGKPAEGTIHLAAQQRGGRIVIEISDDGQGVNRSKVRAKAVEKNLISADANLSDEEIDNLIFLPGFSTADEISNLSGRGVGMDVVRQNIKKLGGRVAIQSKPGEGSRMTMSLPLTLAVLDGMIIRVDRSKYVLPLATIVESLRPQREDLRPIAGGGQVLQIRGQYIDVISLKTVFCDPANRSAASGELIVIVEIDGGERVGLQVDEIVGQQQVVIKSLEENFDPIPGVAGATILGDGNVALILDVPGLRTLHGMNGSLAELNGKSEEHEFAA